MNPISFFKGVKEELKHVNWPKRSTVMVSTVAVVIISTLISIYLDSIDLVLRKLLQLILK
jgi:preprotein translocase SecE subunit